MNPYTRLARAAVEAYVREHRIIHVPGDVPPEMLTTRAPVFVCLKIGGELRGCIGCTEPTEANVAREIIRFAISAASQDFRFLPVRPEELPHIHYSVDVLGEPEPVEGLHQLDPTKYGVIAELGARKGVLLPDLEGVDTARQQVEIAKRKACIAPDEKPRLYRFQVVRYE